MEMQFNKLLDQVTHFMQDEARSETVVGKPFKLGEFHCIPIVRVGMGFGTGGAETEAKTKTHGEVSGIGAGMGIEPIGFLTSKGNEITFVSTKTNVGLAAAFEKVPQLIETFLNQRKPTKEPVLN
jgi:uncharacterized spore protein YtfJ